MSNQTSNIRILYVDVAARFSKYLSSLCLPVVLPFSVAQLASISLPSIFIGSGELKVCILVSATISSLGVRVIERGWLIWRRVWHLYRNVSCNCDVTDRRYKYLESNFGYYNWHWKHSDKEKSFSCSDQGPRPFLPRLQAGGTLIYSHSLYLPAINCTPSNLP